MFVFGLLKHKSQKVSKYSVNCLCALLKKISVLTGNCDTHSKRQGVGKITARQTHTLLFGVFLQDLLKLKIYNKT